MDERPSWSSLECGAAAHGGSLRTAWLSRAAHRRTGRGRSRRRKRRKRQRGQCGPGPVGERGGLGILRYEYPCPRHAWRYRSGWTWANALRVGRWWPHGPVHHVQSTPSVASTRGDVGYETFGFVLPVSHVLSRVILWTAGVPSNADEEFANTFMGDGGARGTSFSPREVVAEVASSSILMVCTPVWRSTSTMKVSCELDT